MENQKSNQPAVAAKPAPVAKPAAAEKIEEAVKAGQETAKKAAEASQETFEKAAKAGTETAGKAVQSGTEAFTKGYEQYVTMTKEQISAVFPAAVEKFDEVADFGKGNVDAFVKAGEVAVKAIETLRAEVADYNRAAWEESVETTKAFFGCKTFQDVVELQSKVARQQFDKLVAEGSKIGELTVKSANEAIEPINARVTEAFDKFGKPIAA